MRLLMGGIISQSIRQRLLENVTLSLDTAFTQARSLELAEKSSNQYNNASSFLNAVELDKLCNDIPSELNAANTKRLCFFCGGTRHNCIQCPAREAICHNCEKTGHFAKVCQSKSKFKKSATAETYPTLAVTLNFNVYGLFSLFLAFLVIFIQTGVHHLCLKN